MTTPTEYVFAGRTLRQPDPTKCRWVYEDTDVKITLIRGTWPVSTNPTSMYQVTMMFERSMTYIPVGMRHTAEEAFLELHRALQEHVTLVQRYTCSPFEGVDYD